MRALLALSAGAGALGVVFPASAEERTRRYDAALGLGYSAGSVLGVPGFTFVGLEASYHWSLRWSVGPYAEFGFIDATVRTQYKSQTYLGHHYRFGAQVFAQLSPQGLIDPWLGLGAGYAAIGVDTRVTTTLSSPPDTSASRATARGFEWLNVQGGVNINLYPALSLGGFARLSLVDYWPRYDGVGEPVRDRLRGWLSGGAKATLRF